MSHPVPSHDYSEQHREESKKQYSHRKATALGRNKNQRMTGKWLKEAGESLRKPGEAPLAHIKRVTGSKTKALKSRKSEAKKILDRGSHKHLSSGLDRDTDRWPFSNE